MEVMITKGNKGKKDFPGGICTNKLLNLRLFDFRHICNHYCQDVSNFICTDRRTCRKS